MYLKPILPSRNCVRDSSGILHGAKENGDTADSPTLYRELFEWKGMRPKKKFVNNGNNWNGNINGTIMRYGLQETNIATPVDYFDEPLLYGYKYDKVNRLISADATVGDYLLAGATDAERRSIGDVSIRFDRIGNILSLHRKLAGQDIQSANPVLPLSEIQHWAYSYGNGTNRLVGVNGASGTVSRAYTYDANGNVLTDDSKIITSTEYGRAAYPFEMLQDETTINYLYSANDLRVYKKSLLSVEVGNEWSEDYYLLDAQGKTVAILHKSQNDITGSWEYYASGAERECRLVPTSTQAPAANIGNTHVKFKKDQVSFYLYDHLGNTRVNYTPTGFISHPGDPSVAVNRINSVVDYFPYGKVLKHYNVTDERYLTTQHERDQETGLDYRGARYYDNEVGRFLSTDPWQDKYPAWSTYNYVMGNPIILIDPTGKGPETKFVDEYGNTIAETNDGSKEIFVIESKDKSTFLNDLQGLASKKKDRDKKANSDLGNKFGYNLDDYLANSKYSSYSKDPGFMVGFNCGYSGHVGSCVGEIAEALHGKGGGVAAFAQEVGQRYRDQGKMSLYEPKVKNNKPEYRIEETKESVVVSTKEFKTSTGRTVLIPERKIVTKRKLIRN